MSGTADEITKNSTMQQHIIGQMIREYMDYWPTETLVLELARIAKQYPEDSNDWLAIFASAAVLSELLHIAGGSLVDE